MGHPGIGLSLVIDLGAQSQSLAVEALAETVSEIVALNLIGPEAEMCFGIASDVEVGLLVVHFYF